MAKIANIRARPVLDSRGDWTIEVILELKNGRRVTASVPQGKSAGSHEIKNVSPGEAVKNIEKSISPKLKDKDVREQRKIDELMIRFDGTPNKRRLGGNAILGVSIVCARAAALARETPLWQYIRNISGLQVQQVRKGILYPRLYINVINGGLHAGNNLDFQEYLVIPKAGTFNESISIGTTIYHALAKHLTKFKRRNASNIGDEGGFAPDFEDNIGPFRTLTRVIRSIRFQKKIDFGLDAAATGISLTYASLHDTYRRIGRNYPLIYLEDPFGEEAFMDFRKLRQRLGSGVTLAGDDLTTTNVSRMEIAYANQSVNAVIIKPNQIGTLSETLDAVRLARKYGWSVVVSHRSGETNDDFIADFAYGIGADGFKLGAPARGERIAKYNRLLEIEKDRIADK